MWGTQVRVHPSVHAADEALQVAGFGHRGVDGVVGTGTAASCTEAAFASAVAAGGVITFDCGGAATIGMTARGDGDTDQFSGFDIYRLGGGGDESFGGL